MRRKNSKIKKAVASVPKKDAWDYIKDGASWLWNNKRDIAWVVKTGASLLV